MLKLLSDFRKDFLVLFLPQNRYERKLFLSLLLFYFLYSLFFIFKTSIIDNTVVEADLYFSFDNPLILKYGRTQISGHPLIYIFYYPFVLLGNLLASLLTFKAKTILFVLLSTSMVSMSCVYINRYLNQIVELSKSIALLLTIFFALFSTCLILSFTPESFTLSLFFLSFNIYFFSKNIKENKSPSLLSTAVLSISLGSVTITNFAKGALPLLFVKDKFWNNVKKGIVVGLMFLGTLCLVHVASLLFMDKDLYTSIINHKNSFIVPTISNASYFTQVIDHFFGAPIFFPELQNFYYYNVQGHWGLYDMKMVQELDYSQWWQYAFVATLIVLLVASLIKNYRNKYVLLIFSLFAIDIIIHCVYRFGLGQPFIYGGHWVYCIPLLLGWLLKGMKGNTQKVFLSILVVLFIGLVANNMVRMIDFSQLVLELYPLVN